MIIIILLVLMIVVMLKEEIVIHGVTFIVIKHVEGRWLVDERIKC